MKVLWLIPKWTFPVTDGARVATDSLLRSTLAAGAVVDVVCLAGADEVCDENELRKRWPVQEVHILRRGFPESRPFRMFYYLCSLISNPLMPLTFASFNEPRIKDCLLNLLDQNSYDRIVLDGLHLGTPFLNGKGLKRPEGVRKIVYRAHNIETHLWKRAQEKSRNVLKRLLLRYQSMLVEKIEQQIISGSDAVAAIAQEDLETMKTMFPEKILKLVPLGMDFNLSLPRLKGTKTKFLFIGRLDWPPNREGLEWILREVWGDVVRKRPEAVLLIAGAGDGRWLEKYLHLPGLEYKGFVRDVKDVYEECHFTIAPLTYGSGTRIKVIESFVMNRRLISTSSGVQGAGLRSQDYIHAETREDWIKTLIQVTLDDEQLLLLAESRNFVLKKYGEKQIGQDFYDWMRTLS